MRTWQLFDEYEVRELSFKEFEPIFKENRQKIFGGQFSFSPEEIYSDEVKEIQKKLAEHMGTPWRFCLGLYLKDQLVGWSSGRQSDREKYYMGNSAVFPEHRGKGLYKAMLKIVIECVAKEGFQIIWSRHTATNSKVIVPKLKTGFVISGMEITDNFGLLVHLSYFTDPIRRKMMDVRSGELFPDDELKKYLKLM